MNLPFFTPLKTCYQKTAVTLSRTFAIAFFLFGLMPGFAQQKKTNVLFEKDQFELTSTAKTKLNKIASDIISSQQEYQIKLIGHTDDDGSHQYNISLSHKRTLQVRQQLVRNGILYQRIEIDSFGETKPVLENLNEKNKSANRRVEILIQFKKPEPIPKEVVIQKTPSCDFDTTIEIAGGTLITLSYCDFKKHRNIILKSETITSPEDMLAHGLSLTTNNGESLITGGMILLGNKDLVFEKPVRIRMPLISNFYNCYDTTVLRQMQLFNANHRGRWNLTDSVTPEFENNETYLSFTVSRGGYFNCDAIALAPVAIIAKGIGAIFSPFFKLIIKNRNTLKFKSVDGDRIKRFSLATRCGSCSQYDIISRKQVKYNRNRTKAKVRLTCCMSSDVVVNYQIYGNRDTTQTTLVDLKTRGIAKLGTCGYSQSQNPRKFFKRMRGRRLNRKYRLQTESIAGI